MSIFTPSTNFSKVSKILLSLLIVLILQTGFAFAQDAPFITVWQTDNPGTSDDNQITIPGTGTDYLIEWEEVGNEANNNGSETGTDEHTITFPSAGTYRVKISGDFTRIEFLINEADRDKILDIEQWGDISWSSFSTAFYYCSNLNQTATDVPNLSIVTDMSSMFRGASSFNGDIGDWDVSNVTQMFALFDKAESFNQDIGNWNVSNVTGINNMFSNASAFNQDLDNWDVSNVTHMNRTFDQAKSFNGAIGSWDVSNVFQMFRMFNKASLFNQDISQWDVSNVRRVDGMFYEAVAFNHDLGGWDLTKVNNLFEFLSFAGLSKTNYDLSLEGWAKGGKVPSSVSLNSEGLTYCKSATYRQKLINDFGWTIIGDELTSCLDLQGIYPAADTTSVEKDTEIYLTFDQEIQEIDFSGITLKDVSGNRISLTDIYIDSLTLHLVHSGLGSNTYQVEIPESSIISITAKENDAISWSFTTQRILSSKEQQKPIGHSAFPNPFSDFTTIQFNLPQSQSFNLFIFDLKGQMVRQEKYENLGSDKQSIRFERKDLPTGLYNYQIQSADGSVGGKMLIQ